MIQRLDHTNSLLAEIMHDVFQKSYAIEAELLAAINFPPLQRTVASFLESQNIFYGFYMDADLAAVIELASGQENMHIQSLVVLPNYFRMGIASGLLSYIFVTHPVRVYTVETGLKNAPAISLYSKNGFIETKQWDTDHGVRKVRLEKKLLT